MTTPRQKAADALFEAIARKASEEEYNPSGLLALAQAFAATAEGAPKNPGGRIA